MKSLVNEFTDYLNVVKKVSINTSLSYERDLLKLCQYLEEQGITDIKKVSETNLNSYILFLEKKGRAASTISRSTASIRSFFNFLVNTGIINREPTLFLKPPKVERKVPEVLEVEEINLLLMQPDLNTNKGKRDRAMLELLYATGMRVSEIISLKVENVNMRMSYIICNINDKERVIPFGNEAKKALNTYMQEARAALVKGNNEGYLFTNCSGKVMSRQGFWKLIKYYGAKAGFACEITPYTLRHSFAAHLVGNGADLKSVQEMMGYSDISTAQIYASMTDSKLRTIYSKAHPRG